MKGLKALVLVICTPAVMAANIYGNAEIEAVTSIYDGDTFRANIAGWPAIIGQRVPIRINGIDTPELRGKCEVEKKLARQAKQLTVATLRAGKHIQLNNMQRGKYFRIIADVMVDGKSLATELVNAGLAVPYHGGTKINWCQ